MGLVETSLLPLQRMKLTGLEKQALLIHGLRVELCKRVNNTTDGDVHGVINLVEAYSIRLTLFHHRNWNLRHFR